jgi:tRNA(Arg) A34 adenosine deaminase TadA
MKFEVDMPPWALQEMQKLPPIMADLESQMRAVIRFSRLNFEHGTGGPFAAGVFEKQTGKLIVIGVNRVVPTQISSAHAEIVAISLAQQILKTYDLGGPGLPTIRLVVNGRPCAMCCGAIVWSGIRSVAIGASGQQIESITGFDEGPIHPQWQTEYQKRGIEVIEDMLAGEACEVFREFAVSDQPVYNSRRS